MQTRADAAAAAATWVEEWAAEHFDVDTAHLWWASPASPLQSPSDTAGGSGALHSQAGDPFDVMLQGVDTSGFLPGTGPCPLMSSAKATRDAMREVVASQSAGRQVGVSEFPGTTLGLGPESVSGVSQKCADLGGQAAAWVVPSTVRALWAAKVGDETIPVRLAVIGATADRQAGRVQHGWWVRLHIDATVACAHAGPSDARLLWSAHPDVAGQLRDRRLNWTERGVRLPSLWQPQWDFQIAVGLPVGQPWDEQVVMSIARETLGECAEEVRPIRPLSFVDVTDGWANLAYSLRLRSLDYSLDRATATGLMERFRAGIARCCNVRVQGDTPDA